MLSRTACKPTNKEIDKARDKEIDQAFGRSFGKSVTRLKGGGCTYLQKIIPKRIHVTKCDVYSQLPTNQPFTFDSKPVLI